MITAGECHLQRRTNPETGQDELFVLRTDPTALISAGFLEEISVLTERDEDRFSSVPDGVLTIHGVNRKVIYRVDYASYDALSDTYRMEWPD
jgi:hypothetical protein